MYLGVTTMAPWLIKAAPVMAEHVVKSAWQSNNVKFTLVEDQVDIPATDGTEVPLP